MKIIQLGESIDNSIVLCLGFFGSMHLGHVELLNRAKRRAQTTNSKVALFTFDNNHLGVLKRESTLMYTFQERLSIYQSLGVDYVITATFNDDFKALTGNQFLDQLNKYNLESAFCGFDHRCGRDHLDALGIRKYLKDIPVYIVEKICVAGEKVSTSLLRQYLIDNKIDTVNSLLSEPFFVIGNVVHGRGVGKSLGFPTANVQVPADKLLPIGVFAGKITLDNCVYPAIINIGNMPTFAIEYNTVEAHIIGFDGDLYGKNIKISLIKYLRPITKFNSPDELSRQLNIDKEATLND